MSLINSTNKSVVKGMQTTSLKKQKKELADAKRQLEILSNGIFNNNELPTFATKIKAVGQFPLRPKKLEILQINLGYMCNQVCEHCHVDAGPDRKEVMTKQTMQYCLDAIDNSKVKIIDITGGAPEMNPNFIWFIEQLSIRDIHIIIRSNLTILMANKKYDLYPDLFKKHNLEVIASLPCYTKENTDKQRGDGVFAASISALKMLNSVGYGMQGTGLKLNLVFNPIGASIAPNQEALEKDYKKMLRDDFDIEFNNLYTITNLPISRFLDYLIAAGRYQEYMAKLVEAFNPRAAKNVMCRNTISVSWDGDLYDCDFNQMLEMKVDKRASQHIREFDSNLLEERKIAVNNHCYGCTAGAGSSCQGSLS